MGNCNVDDNSAYRKYSKKPSYFPDNPFVQDEYSNNNYNRNNTMDSYSINNSINENKNTTTNESNNNNNINKNNIIQNNNINCNANNCIVNNTTQDVYRIMRKRKVIHKKRDKLESNNITPIQDNNTNNSTTSKSKNTTESSDNNGQKILKVPESNIIYNINIDKFSRLKTLQSQRNASSIQLANANIMNNLNKNINNKNENKIQIRKNVHSNNKIKKI